jgi:hypothetical protein
MDLLLVAFGAFFVVEFAKAVVPGKVPPWACLLVAGLSAGAIAFAFDDPAPLGLAGAGLAAVVQKAHRMLSAAGDFMRVRVLSTVRPRF